MPLACNLQAIGPADRPRYGELVNRLRSSMKHRAELADGYRYQLDSNTISAAELAEWIAMERLCCPFLEFELDEVKYLTLRGPAGAKAIIGDEFPGLR